MPFGTYDKDDVFVKGDDGTDDGKRIGAIDDRLKVNAEFTEKSTFVVHSITTTIGNNKSMISLLNASGSGQIVRLKTIQIVNTRNAALTGTETDFRLRRFTGHSSGTLLTPDTYDSIDSISGSITVRTGATITGESASYLLRWVWSSDEWGTGSADTESFDHTIQQMFPIWKKPDQESKDIVIRAAEGLHVKCETNSTNGAFDINFVFTTELE